MEKKSINNTQLKPSEYTLTLQEVERLINECTNFRDRVIIKVLYYCGLRVSELVHLQVGHIDFDRCRLNVIEGKGGKTGTVPLDLDKTLPYDIKTLLNGRKRGFVFMNDKGEHFSR